MGEQDELLQQALEALEQGESLEKILTGLPQGGGELRSLLRLAAAVRTLEHPSSQIEEINWAGDIKTRPVARRAHPDQGRTPAFKFPWRLPSLGRAFAPALAGSLGLAVLALVLVLTLALPGRQAARAATLEIVNGQVEIAGEGSGAWRTAAEGENLAEGMSLRTAPGAAAALLFSDGSRAFLGPDAEVTIARLSASWAGGFQVALRQEKGSTDHQVQPLKGRGSQYRVLTAAGEISVQGTAFKVQVLEDGRARVSVDHGEVQVSNDQSNVSLSSGQTLASLPGQPLEAPSYQFSLRGSLSSSVGSTGFVAGVPFTLLPSTYVAPSAKVGSTVQVDGRILAGGDWVADSITLITDDTPLSTFTGAVEAVQNDRWEIDGWTVAVAKNTRLEQALQIGTPVRVSFIVRENGIWQAVRIEALDGSGAYIANVQPTETTGPQFPKLEFQPDEVEAETCAAQGQSTFSFESALGNEAPASLAAEKVSLGYQILRGAEYVSQVMVSPAGMETISAGQSVPVVTQVTLNSPAWSGAPVGAEIKVRLYIAGELNRPAGHHTRLTLTLRNTCAPAEATPTLQSTPATSETPPAGTPPQETPTAEPTPTPGVDIVTQPGEQTLCTGAQPHPTGTSLAEKYGVGYNEIMSWFCQGFGFGEIDLGYEISRAVPIPVEQVFAMKSGGMGWGEIKQQLLPDKNPGKGPEPKQNSPSPGKGNGPEKTRKPKK